MRRRISWLVVATTSTVVASFVIPLCLLVRNLAEERAMSAADQEARNVAIVVAGLHNNPAEMREFIERLDARGVPKTGVLTPDGAVLGSDPELAGDPEVQRALSGGESFHVENSQGAEVLIAVLVPRRDNTTGTAVIRSSVSRADLHQGVAQAWASIIGLGLLLLILSQFVAVRFGRRISEPLRAVAGVAHQLREGNLQARAGVSGTEETQELAQALNGLADRTEELLAAERAAVGDLSHRLRTPVTALRLDAESVTEPGLASRLQEHIATLQVTIDSIVAEARRPVRSDFAAACDASAAVAERVGFWQALAEDQGRAMRINIAAEPLWVPVAESDLADVVDVLIDNVFAHTSEGTPFGVRLTQDAGFAALVVADRGPGLPAGGRQERPGSTGLGLDIARRLAEGGGGSLTVGPNLDQSGLDESGQTPTGGARVELRLPLTRP